MDGFSETLKQHLDSSPLAVVQWDRSFQVIYWSSQAERLFGWETAEVLGKKPEQWKFVHEADRDAVAAIMKELMSDSKPRNVCPNRNYNRNGDTLYCEWYNSVLYNADGKMESFLSLVLDVTAQKALELKYQRAQRLENIALLTGGISHDLNNILAPISLGAELIRNQTEDNRILNTLSIITRAVERGSNLVRHILSFSRGAEDEPVLLEPQRTLKDVEDLLKLGFSKNIEFRRLEARDCWKIEANLTHLNQILVNLCVNARDSMANGGQLTLSAYNQKLEETLTLSTGVKLSPGNYVAFRIEDTGEGIPENIRDKIFDPFFSTKSSEKGTGLGLSNSLELVKFYRGGIEFTSSRKTGTTFDLYFPAAPDQDTLQQQATELETLPQGHGQSLLVVDDEKSIRKILQSLLKANGYHALTAPDGAIALGKLHEKATEIQAVITDIDMPNIDGINLVRTMKNMGLEHIPVLSFYGSATEKEHKVKQMKKLGVRHFIKKPFDSKKFLTVVAEMLHQEAQ